MLLPDKWPNMLTKITREVWPIPLDSKKHEGQMIIVVCLWLFITQHWLWQELNDPPVYLSVPPYPLTIHILGPTLRDLIIKQEKGMFFSSGHAPSIVGRDTGKQCMVHVLKESTMSQRKKIHTLTTGDHYYQCDLTRHLYHFRCTPLSECTSLVHSLLWST